MKQTLILLVVVLSIAASLPAFADDQSNGCGLGWQVTNRTTLLATTTRDTTNYFLPNTFSMTSGTSGCAKHDIVKNDERAVLFAVNNYNSLVVEMAEGHGEFLDGFAQSLGCDATTLERFHDFTQSHYSSIMNQNGSGEGISLYQAVRTQMLASPEFDGRCVPQA